MPHPPAYTHPDLHSLTEGFHSGGLQFHSYALHLRELLKSALPSGCQVVVHERGRSGEFVLRTMQVWMMNCVGFQQQSV